jgi:hypothetical protein
LAEFESHHLRPASSIPDGLYDPTYKRPYNSYRMIAPGLRLPTLPANRRDTRRNKRDAIFARIEKLQAEVNRDRTKSEVVVGLWLDLTSAISNGAKNLDPAIDRLERIMKILGVARDDDATARLPAPQEPKQIPPPASQENDDGQGEPVGE